MKEASTNHPGRMVLSVVAGILSAFIAGLILLPLVRIMYDRYFNIYLFVQRPPGAWKDDLVIEITLAMWFLISSLSGGIICALISPTRVARQVLICALIVTGLFLWVYSDDLWREHAWPIWLIVCCIPAGYFAGSAIAKHLRQKRKA